MAKLAVHPHVGFLNTDFSIHLLKGDSDQPVSNLSITISMESNDNSKKTEVQTVVLDKDKLCTIYKFTQPGRYNISFADGSENVVIEVKDAIRFGGGQYKKSYIFDETPWCFIVMGDRTYFYNRDSKEQYVESISPDNIEFINANVVLFKSDKYEECSLYSLSNHKIFANYKNGTITNKKWLISEICNNEHKELNIIFFDEDLLSTNSIAYDKCLIDGEANRVYTIFENTISVFSLENMDIVEHKTHNQGVVLSFTNNHYYILQKQDRIFEIYNIAGFEWVTQIQAENPVEHLGSTRLLDEKQILDFKTNLSNIRESLNNPYKSCVQYRISSIDNICISNGAAYFIETERIASVNAYGSIRHSWMYHIKRNTQIISSSSERFSSLSIEKGNRVCGCDHKGMKFHIDEYGRLRYNKLQFRNEMSANMFMKQQGGTIKICKNNAGKFFFVCGKIEGKLTDKVQEMYLAGELDFSELSYIEVHQEGIFDKDLSGKLQERWIPCLVKKKNPQEVTKTKQSAISSALTIPFIGTADMKAQSESGKYTISTTGNQVWLSHKIWDGDGVFHTQILESLYDISTYSNVYLSDDGDAIIHRNNGEFLLKSISTGEEYSFPNIDFVTHNNGYRPLVSLKSCRKPVMIDPITRQAIDGNTISKYSFISPDKRLYTNTQQVIRYYHKLKEIEISQIEYNKIREELPILPYTLQGDKRREIVCCRERSLGKYLHKLDKNDLEAYDIMDLVVETRGFVEVKRCDNDDIVATIPLGKALWFLNYVSFSYDGRYVAIAGRYPDNSIEDGRSIGGLFMVYDLQTCSVICKKTDGNACWRTAFTKSNIVVSYSSEPNTYIKDINSQDAPLLNSIYGKNFLTFSPDGKYMALSNQSYVRYNGGEYGQDWGHMPSTSVYIRPVTDLTNDVIPVINDLSDYANGISGVCDKRTAASCSFSLDNKKLMMVGNDGVVVIRNLNLE